MSIDAAKLRVDVEANTAKADKGLKEFDTGLKGVKGGFDVAGTAAKAFAGVAVVSFGKSLINAASDYNETLNKTQVVFGASTSEITKNVDLQAKKFGLNKTAMLDAASGFGLLGQAAGITGAPLTTMSTKLTNLAADAASFYNVPMEQALADFGSALSGESEPVKKYGVLMNEAAVGAEAMRLGISKTGKDLTEGQKVQARSSLIMAGMSKAQGDLARTATGTANRTRELTGRIDNAKASIGQALLPALGLALTAILGFGAAAANAAGFVAHYGTAFRIAAGIITALFLPAMIKAGVASVTAGAKTALGWLTAQTASAGGAIRVGASWASTAASAVASAAASFAAHVRVVAGWVMAGAQSLLAAARVAAAWLIAMGPIALVIAAVVGVVVLIVRNWDTILAATSRVWGAITGAVKAAWDAVVGAVKAAVEWVRQAISTGFAAIVGAIQAYVNRWKEVIAGAWAAIKAIVSAAVAGVKAVIAGMVSIVATIVGFFAQVREGITGKIGEVLTFLRGVPGKIVHALGNTGKMLWSAGVNVIQGFIGGLKSMGHLIGSVLVGLLPGPLRKFAGKLGLGSPSKVFAQYGRWTGGGYVNGLKDTYRAVTRGASGLAEAAMAGTRAVVGGPGGAVGTRATPPPPGAVQAPSARGGPTFQFTVYNPVAEATSVTTNRALQRTAVLGLV